MKVNPAFAENSVIVVFLYLIPNLYKLYPEHATGQEETRLLMFYV